MLTDHTEFITSRFDTQFIFPWINGGYQKFLKTKFYSAEESNAFLRKYLYRRIEFDFSGLQYELPENKTRMKMLLLITKFIWTAILIEIVYEIFPFM